MQIEKLRRWHWAVIGVAIGLLFSFWGTWVGPEPKLIGRATLEPSEFEKLLPQKSSSGQPILRDIRVYRLRDGTHWLTAEQLFRRGNHPAAPGQYVPVKIPARTPYVPTINPPAQVDPQYTIIDFLNELKVKEPALSYSTRWWAHEPVRSPVYALAGLVLVGGLFPMLVSALGTAQGGQAKEKEQEYDLSRFGKDKPGPARPTGPRVTDQDLQHVRELDEELERRLSGRAVDPPGEAAPPPAGQQASATPPRKLDGGPLEVHEDDKPKKPKHYGGEFYPTETHAKPNEE